MTPLLTDLPTLGSIQSALDQPIFPGKLIIWFLFMLSIVSWVMILSKALHLWRVRRADRRFEARLRKSRTTLELFETGWRDEDSVQFLIYLAGARETAFQLLGSRNPVRDLQARIREAGKLSDQQESFLEGAFDAGLRQAMLKLLSGVAGLRFVAAAAALFSAIGCVWTLMGAFDSQEPGAPIGPIIGSALGFLAIGLLVLTPAVLARVAFSIHIEKRRYEIEKFRDDICRVFERKFGLQDTATAEPIEEPDDVSGEEQSDSDPTPDNQIEFPDPGSSSGGGKRYHSIRDRLLRPPEDDDTAMNPIARQARIADAHG